MLLYEPLHFSELPEIQAMILRQRNFWLKPELRLPARALHMNMQSPLFAREEVEAKLAITKDR